MLRINLKLVKANVSGSLVKTLDYQQPSSERTRKELSVDATIDVAKTKTRPLLKT